MMIMIIKKIKIKKKLKVIIVLKKWNIKKKNRVIRDSVDTAVFYVTLPVKGKSGKVIHIMGFT